MSLLTGLQQYYRFDSDTEGIINSEIGEHTLELIGGAAIVSSPSVLGNAVDCDALGRYVSNGVFPIGTGDFSLSFWIRVSEREDLSRYVLWLGGRPSASGGPVFTMRIDDGGKLQASKRTAAIIWSDILAETPLNEWLHICITRAGASAKYYINGIEELEITESSAVDFTQDNDLLQLGASRAGGNQQGRYEGFFDEFGVWNRVLSPSEVGELYNAGAGFDPTASEEYDVSIDQTNSPVTQLNTLEVDVTVENTGSVTGQQDIKLFFGTEENEVDSETVSLDASQSDQITLTYQIPIEVDPGTYTIWVKSDDSEDTAQVEVVAPQLEINLTSPQEGQEFAGFTVNFVFQVVTNQLLGTAYLFINKPPDADIAEARESYPIESTGTHDFSETITLLEGDTSGQVNNTWFVRFIPD
jgi:hypothetical protein